MNYNASQWLAIIVALGLLVACCHATFGKDHPFGEQGTERRAEAEQEAKDRIQRAYHYAFWWAQQNGLKVPDRVPNAILCRSEAEVAERTHCPATERGGRVVARADINSGFIFLSRPSTHDLYHECYHVLFRSWDERNAEAFAAWCLKMDKGLEKLQRAQR